MSEIRPVYGKRPTHHFSLSDGKTELGFILCNAKGEPDPRAVVEQSVPRVAMQMRSGDPDYSDFNLPFSPITQKDFSGGRGMLDFKRDKTRYYDAIGLETSFGNITLGGEKYVHTKAGRYTNYTPDTTLNIPPDAYEIPKIYSSPYTHYASITVGYLEFKFKLGGDNADQFSPSTAVLRFFIHADNDGQPGARLVHRVVFARIDNSRDFVTVRAFMDFPLTAGEKYWFGIYGIPSETPVIQAKSGTTDNHKTWVGSYNGSTDTWTSLYSSNKAITFTVYDYPYLDAKFFEHKGILHAATTGYGLWTTIRQLGVVGRCTSDIGYKEKAATGKPYMGFDNAYFIITGGKGFDQVPNYRKIIHVDYPTGVVTFDRPFDFSLDATTTYLILGWQGSTPDADLFAVPGGVYTFQGRPTSIVTHGDTIWIARGSQYPILKLKPDTDNLFSQSTDGSNYADFLAVIPSANGKYRLWRAIASTSQVSYTETFSYASASTFSTPAIVCGNPLKKITNMIAYGNPAMPYILKEDSIGSINNDVYAEIPIGELKLYSSTLNGMTAIQKDIYLMFSFKTGLERYYDNRLDDIGVNRDIGLPIDRQGYIVKLATAPGKIFAAVSDHQANARSSIYMHNGSGWHEIYTTEGNDVILDMVAYSYPMRNTGKLYFVLQSGEISSVPIYIWEQDKVLKTKAIDGYYYPYQYNRGGYLITGWYTGSYKEIEKYWHKVTLYGQNVDSKPYQTDTLEVYYQLDGEHKDQWTPMKLVELLPTRAVYEFPNKRVTSKRARFKIVAARLWNVQDTFSIEAITIDTIERITPKRAWQVTFTYADRQTNLQGQPERITIEDLKGILDRWADSDQTPHPLIAKNLFNGLEDETYVFIEPPQVRYIDAQIDGVVERKVIFTTNVMSI